MPARAIGCNRFSEGVLDQSGVAVPLTWFRAPQGDDPGTTNLCYVVLDRQVISGNASAPALRSAAEELDAADLLERVAALAGAFRGLGVTPGDTLGIDLTEATDELLALLAAARLGAVAHLGRPAGAQLWVTDRPVASSGEESTADGLPVAAIVRGVAVADPVRELDWEIAYKAGRTDPAPVAELPGDAIAYSRGDDQPDVPVHDALGATDAWGRAFATLAAGEVLDLTGSRADAERSA